MATEDQRIRELIDRRQYTKDANGTEAAQRSFVVFNAGNEAGALQIFNDYEDGKKFPGAAPLCVLDSANVSGQNGNTVWIVTASYSTFKGFVRRQTAEESNNFTPFWSWGYKRVEVEIPFTHQIALLSNTGEELYEFLVYNVKKLKVMENRLLRILKVKYQTNNVASLDVIADQDRKLHEIRGKKYLFAGADVQQDVSDPTIFFITYTWEYDKGTWMKATDECGICFAGTEEAFRGAQDPTVGYIIAPAEDNIMRFTWSGNHMVRWPYTISDLTAWASPDFIPSCKAILLFDDSDLEGYRSLPGMVPV